MTQDVSRPSGDNPFVLTCYNAGSVALGANKAVKLAVTASTPNMPAVKYSAATAGTTTGSFGVTLEAIATGAHGPVLILGPVVVTANATVAVHAPLTQAYGTAGVLGRVISLAIATAGAASTTKYLGYALTNATAAGQQIKAMVNPAKVPLA